jgi:Tfp pilus assembly protein PilX
MDLIQQIPHVLLAPENRGILLFMALTTIVMLAILAYTYWSVRRLHRHGRNKTQK